MQVLCADADCAQGRLHPKERFSSSKGYGPRFSSGKGLSRPRFCSGEAGSAILGVETTEILSSKKKSTIGSESSSTSTFPHSFPHKNLRGFCPFSLILNSSQENYTPHDTHTIIELTEKSPCIWPLLDRSK